MRERNEGDATKEEEEEEEKGWMYPSRKKQIGE
jgi:hypothetical protein